MQQQSTPFPMTISSFSPSPPFFPLSSSNSSFLSPPLRHSATTVKLLPALCAQASPATTPLSLSPTTAHSNSQDQALITLLRQRKTEEAWQIYSSSSAASIPSSTCLSRLLAQLSYQNTPESLSRAQSIISRLRDAGQLHRLDSNSLGLLAASAAKSGDTRYANSVIKSMLRSNFLPHVKAWSAVVSRLAAAPDDGPSEAIRLFYAVTRRVRRLDIAGDSRPDTAAFNAVLNACANVGDAKKFCQVFDEMPQWNVTPDALTYNVLIKLCGRAGRKDLLVSVLEMLLVKGIQPCATTFHSLVAAYVGFGDLESAEKLVQAMREGRRDVCRILRNTNNKIHDEKEGDSEEEEEDEYDEEEEDEVKYEDDNGTYNANEKDEFLDKLIPIAVEENDFVPPLLPKEYAPDSRIYTTLMKGYMKAGRVSDTVRTLEAMRHQKDTSSHPDHVSYTTVISAFVKAGSMDRARQVLAEMTRVGVPANRVTYNILLKGYCHQMQIERAKELVREMTKAGILPDVVSYNTLIDGCILAEDSSGALNYFNEMRGRGLAPTKISYTTLMKAFALSGQPNLANRVFDEMLKDPRVKADQVAWNMLVEGYCKLGLIEEAKKVVERMKEHGFHPDVATYGSLANGIAVARKPGEALLLWKEVKERCKVRRKEEEGSEPPPPPIEPDEGLLDTLADICVRAAFFKKALEIGACMEEYGISPNKTKFSRIYVEMHSRMFSSKHASQARQDKRKERKRAAEAFKFWLGLPNNYYSSDWSLYRGDNVHELWNQ